MEMNGDLFTAKWPMKASIATEAPPFIPTIVRMAFCPAMMTDLNISISPLYGGPIAKKAGFVANVVAILAGIGAFSSFGIGAWWTYEAFTLAPAQIP